MLFYIIGIAFHLGFVNPKLKEASLKFSTYDLSIKFSELINPLFAFPYFFAFTSSGYGIIHLAITLILETIGIYLWKRNKKEIEKKQLTKKKKPKIEKLPKGIYQGKIKSNNKIYSVEAELVSKSKNLLYNLKIISPSNLNGIMLDIHPKKLEVNWKLIDDENYSTKKRENIAKLREFKNLLDQKIIDLNDYESKLSEYKHTLFWKLEESIINKEFNANTAKTKIIELQEYLDLDLISKTEYDNYHTCLKKFILK